MMRHTAHFDAGDGPGFHVRKRSTMEIVRRVAVYLKPYRGMAAANVGCAILSLGFSFAFPQLLQSIIDDVIGGKRTSYLAPAALLAAAFLMRDLFNSLRIRINNHFEQNVIFDMRRDVYARLQRLPVGYFDQRASGDLMTRVIEDVNSVERVLIDGTEQGTVATLSVLGVMAVLFCKNPYLAAVALIPIPLLTGGVMWYTLTAHRRYRAQRRASSALSALLMDSLQGIRQIKAFGRQEHEDGRFAQHADALRQANLGVMRVWAVVFAGHDFRRLARHGAGALARRRAGGGGKNDRRPTGRLYLLPRPVLRSGQPAAWIEPDVAGGPRRRGACV